jgi:hypothetical protein
MYVEGVGQKSGPCTATFNDLLCLKNYLTDISVLKVPVQILTIQHHKIKAELY